MVKKLKNYSVRTTGRMMVVCFSFAAVITTLGYTLFNNLKQVNVMNKELKSLEEEKVSLLEKEDELNADIKRLSDPLYVARYAREKYLYSKDGELILRFEE